MLRCTKNARRNHAAVDHCSTASFKVAISPLRKDISFSSLMQMKRNMRALVYPLSESFFWRFLVRSYSWQNSVTRQSMPVLHPALSNISVEEEEVFRIESCGRIGGCVRPRILWPSVRLMTGAALVAGAVAFCWQDWCTRIMGEILSNSLWWGGYIKATRPLLLTYM